jgi:hypothetical protein
MRTKELVSPVVSSGMYPAWASSSPLPLLHKREQSFEELPSGFFSFLFMAFSIENYLHPFRPFCRGELKKRPMLSKRENTNPLPIF